MMKAKIAVLPLVSMLMAASAQAVPGTDSVSNSWFGGKKDGWYFYKDPKPKQESSQPVAEIPPPPASKQQEASTPKAQGPALFSVDWLRKNLDTLRDKAEDDPSDENVRNYLYAQRMMMDKSENFAQAAVRVAQTDPYLDENNRFPFATAARFAALSQEKSMQKEALKFLAGKGGLWFFFDSRCTYCKTMEPTLKEFSKNFGFNIRYISMDGLPLPGMKQQIYRDQGQFRNFGLTLTPSIVFAVPPDKIIIVAQGAMSYDQLQTRMMMAAANEKLLPDGMDKQVNILSRGIVTPDQLKNLKNEGVNEDDPGSWIQWMRKKLNLSY